MLELSSYLVSELLPRPMNVSSTSNIDLPSFDNVKIGMNLNRLFRSV
jgi:hypothetical protein